MPLETFTDELRAIMGDDDSLRPFVCEGSPLACQALIVGANPATDMRPAFWPWWDSQYGFRKGLWFEVYKHARRERRQAGENIREVSPTRSGIEAVLRHGPKRQVLETNIYATASRMFAQLAAAQRVERCFELLGAMVPYDMILAHGAEARKYFERFVGSLPVDVPIVREFQGRQVTFFATAHLCIGSPSIRGPELARVLSEA